MSGQVVSLQTTTAPSAGHAAFRALYDAEVDFVWRNLRRLGVPDGDLEDRTQEVFAVVFRRFADFADQGFGARAWLYQILFRVTCEARRHRRRHPEHPDGGESGIRAAVEPEQSARAESNERLALLDRALDRLDVAKRAVLVMHEIEEMSAPEIAQALAVPLNTVYSRLRAARAELELALKVVQAAGALR